MRVAASDPDIVHRAADQLPAVGHQHNLISFFDRERGDEAAVAVVDGHRPDALAAAARGSELIRRRALAEALGRDRQYELFAALHLGELFRAQIDITVDHLVSVGINHHFGIVSFVRPAQGGGLLEEGRSLGRRRHDVVEDRHRDDFVTFAEPDAAHAIGIAALEQAHFLTDQKADALALGGRQLHILIRPRDCDRDDAVAFVEFHCLLAVAVDVLEIGQRVAADVARAGREHQFEFGPGC